MKIKYSSIVGILAALVLIASFVVPGRLASPEPASAASAQSQMQWWPVDTPDVEAGQTKSLFTPVLTATLTEGGSELVKLLVGNDGNTMYCITSQAVNPADLGARSMLRYRKSTNGGRSWSVAGYNNLVSYVTNGLGNSDVLVWDMCIAQDNPNIVAAAITALPGITNFRVWISTDGGTNWDNTQWPPPAPMAPIVPGDYISALDISMDYGGRDMLVGTRNGTGLGVNTFWTMKMPGYGGWNVQNAVNGQPASTQPFIGDILAAKFSPTYNGDSTIAVVYSQPAAGGLKPGTWLVTGVHDIARNLTNWQPTGSHVEIKNSSSPIGRSPNVAEIITADIQMPSDFSGQSASLRRIYISTDAIDRVVGVPGTPDRGVYRIDDNVVYTLMDTSTTFQYQNANLPNKRVAHIAYWGTYASGKLLVGERLGSACTATVPVWFTDSPTVCPVPCWYPAKKPPTGAAGQIGCFPNMQGYGNAMPVWSPTFAAQGVAYAITGSMSYDGPYAAYVAQAVVVYAPSVTGGTWPSAIFNVVPLDESAFSLTRNNGETWNQLSLIDTRMNKLTDVAPSADCTTVYLASVNNGVQCMGFDSVWRSSTNEKVVAPPLPALPIGQVWERVRTSYTAITCNSLSSNYAILRLAPDKLDGQVVGWAAGGTANLGFIGTFPVGVNTRALSWSPDFGDYWADIVPRVTVQDFAFETSTIMYVMDRNGNVQKMPYTGTAWSSTIQTVDSANAGGGHTIEAMAPDKVLVGNRSGAGTPYPASISTNGAAAFVPLVRPLSTPPSVGNHVLFDTDFAKNATIYVASDGGYAPNPAVAGITDAANGADVNLAATTGVVFRNTAPAGSNVDWTDMMTGMCFIGYAGPHFGYYGLAQSNSKNVTGQGTLYAAHTVNGGAAAFVAPVVLATAWSGVERTLAPLDGIPKPGLEWTCLDATNTMFRANHPIFTLEPKSLKLCGCLTQDTNTSLYAIDNDFYSNVHNVAAQRLSRFGVGFAMGVKTTGLLWEYTDCVAKKGPKLTLDDGAIIGCDPATGRNQEVNFRWEQLCIASTYQLQIAKDKAFTLQVFDTGPVCGVGALGLRPVDITSPAFVFFSAGAGAMPGFPVTLGTTAPIAVGFVTPQLECGHAYFWRVRVLDEVTFDIVNSPWSEVRGFTIKAGFRVTTPYYGPQLLAPDNGCGCACNAPIAFSWSPFKETVEYQFVLSENADLSSPLVTTAVKTTAYQYTGTVKCNKTYFWRVMSNKPAPSEWSAVFSFNTQPEPAKPAAPPPAPETPMWVWVIIAIGAILVIVTLVLIFKTRRV